MATIGIVSQKGGVSKSSLARALAVTAATGGLSAKIADLDVGQGSTVDWHKDRMRGGLAPEVSVQMHKSAREAIAAANGVDVLIFDGPAKADEETLEIARAADLVVQPTGASLDDLRPAVRVFNALVKRGVPPSRLLYVLSRISTDAEARAARDYLADAGYAVAAGYLPERAAYRATQDVGRSLVEVRIKSLKVAADEVVQAVIDAIPEPEGEGA